MLRSLFIAFILSFIAGIAFIYFGGMGIRSSASAAHDALVPCFATTTDPTFARTCLEQNMQALLGTNSTAAVMEYIVATSSPRILLDNCHPISHVVGKQTYQSSASLEVALSRCTDDCARGCLHGVIGEAVETELGEDYEEDVAHADAATIQTIGGKYCAMSGAICHAIGHILFMKYKTSIDALRGCDAVSDGLRSEGCYEGVFMEALGTRNSLGYYPATKVEAETEPGHPCTTLPVKYQYACFLYLPEFHYRPVNAEEGHPLDTTDELEEGLALCQTFEGKMRSDCVSGLINSTEGKNRAKNFCATMEGRDHESCVLGIVRKYTLYANFRSALGFCADIQGDKALCYNATFQKLLSAKDSVRQDAVRACEEAPTSEECASYLSEYFKVSANLPEYQWGLYGKME